MQETYEYTEEEEENNKKKNSIQIIKQWVYKEELE